MINVEKIVGRLVVVGGFINCWNVFVFKCEIGLKLWKKVFWMYVLVRMEERNCYIS